MCLGLTCFCIFNLVDVPDYCAVHPADILPAPDNCAHYYNCSAINAALPPRMISRKLMSGVLDAHEMECTYPDLFDVSSRSCRNFTTVTCKSRPEPQAPCKNFFIYNVDAYKMFHLCVLKFC